ncbi:putative cucumisin [Helianthus annuus]|nr:putative cucumisin [Helianthus annuus]KAJ0679690.1 putative cucumisin [Helianthus annuus]KAJ0727073.1 putative cucumisin [Helianthus annuus]KAJ0864382.1 putative cucumisin [Helianthus annuus]
MFSLQSYNMFSAKDTSGRGTHVASIISGREVIDVSYYDIAKGIARGGVPSTRIAAYKVCYHINFYDVYVLSAFDHAIADGVDIISVSIARPRLVELTFDPIAIGAFHAMEKGILTVNAAGNCQGYRIRVGSSGSGTNTHTHTLAENKEHENLRGGLVKVTYVHGLQLRFHFY